MEYASPRPFDDAHLVTSEGGLDWVRGVEPCVGKIKDITVVEWMSAFRLFCHRAGETLQISRTSSRTTRRKASQFIYTNHHVGARLATNGVILCRCAIPFFEVEMIFELDGARGIRARVHLPLLVDEFVRVKLKVLSHA